MRDRTTLEGKRGDTTTDAGEFSAGVRDDHEQFSTNAFEIL